MPKPSLNDRASESRDPVEKDRLVRTHNVISSTEVKVYQYTGGVISMLCGRSDVRNRATPLRGHSIGMIAEYHFENTYRSHDIRLECGMRMNPSACYCIFDVSYCTIRGVIVVAVAKEGGWYTMMLIRSAMQLLLDMRRPR